MKSGAVLVRWHRRQSRAPATQWREEKSMETSIISASLKSLQLCVLFAGKQPNRSHVGPRSSSCYQHIFSCLLISELSREKASGISPAPNEHRHSSRRWTNYNFHVVKFHVSRCNHGHVKRPICQSCCEARRKKTGGSIDVSRISPEQYLSRSPFL